MSKKPFIWEFKRTIYGDEPFYSDRHDTAVELLGKWLESMAVELTEWHHSATGYGYIKVQFLEACSESERQRIVQPLVEKWGSPFGIIPANTKRVVKYREDLGLAPEITVKPKSFLDTVADKLKQNQGVTSPTGFSGTGATGAANGGANQAPAPYATTPWFGWGASTPLAVNSGTMINSKPVSFAIPMVEMTFEYTLTF